MKYVITDKASREHTQNYLRQVTKILQRLMCATHHKDPYTDP